jgi:uncharacterized protein with PQ loop repeat
MFFISILAAICSTTASIPQLMGHVTKLSNATMVIRFIGAVFWCVYGVLILEYALIVSSCVAALVEVCLLVKTNYRPAPKPTDTAQCPIDAGPNSSLSIDRAEPVL